MYMNYQSDIYLGLTACNEKPPLGWFWLSSDSWKNCTLNSARYEHGGIITRRQSRSEYQAFISMRKPPAMSVVMIHKVSPGKFFTGYSF